MTGFVSGPQEQGADREAGRCEGIGETPWGRCEALSSWAASVDCGLPDRAAARRERLAHRARRGPLPPFGPRRGLARLIRAVPTLGPRSPRSLAALAGRERRSVCPRDHRSGTLCADPSYKRAQRDRRQRCLGPALFASQRDSRCSARCRVTHPRLTLRRKKSTCLTNARKCFSLSLTEL